MIIDIDQKDFGTLCICALRYCHGRRSYMPSLVQKIVGRHLDSISDHDVNVMYNDCRFMMPADYGDEIDKPGWLLWESNIKKEHLRREQGAVNDEDE